MVLSQATKGELVLNDLILSGLFFLENSVPDRLQQQHRSRLLFRHIKVIHQCFVSSSLIVPTQLWDSIVSK